MDPQKYVPREIDGLHRTSFFTWTFGIYIPWPDTLISWAVVAPDQLRCVGSNHTHPIVAADKLLGSVGGHRAQGSDAQLRKLSRANES